MQIKIKDNIKQFEKKLTDAQKKQLPYATAQAINNTLFGLRKEMAKQTEKKLDRPTPFTKRGFLISKAKKSEPIGILYIRPEVAKYLKWVIDAGVKKTSSSKIPVPILENKRLNKYGNIAGKRSGLVKGSKEFIATIGETTGVWKKQGGRLILLIKFHDSVTYSKKSFNFYKIGKGYIKSRFNKELSRALTKALSKAK
jgi:hypothetical protein